MPDSEASRALSQQALTTLRGVGPKLEQKLNRIGLYSVQDLLFHLPLRYQDRTRVQAMGSLRPGEQAVVEGLVELTEIGFGRRRTLLCHISDGTGSILLRFFHFSNAQKEALSRDTRLRCFGEVRAGKKYLEMIHPEYSRISADEVIAVEETLTPLYPTTEGVHQLKMRDLVQQALQYLQHDKLGLGECLPAEILAQNQIAEYF